MAAEPPAERPKEKNEECFETRGPVAERWAAGMAAAIILRDVHMALLDAYAGKLADAEKPQPKIGKLYLEKDALNQKPLDWQERVAKAILTAPEDWTDEESRVRSQTNAGVLWFRMQVHAMVVFCVLQFWVFRVCVFQIF